MPFHFQLIIFTCQRSHVLPPFSKRSSIYSSEHKIWCFTFIHLILTRSLNIYKRTQWQTARKSSNNLFVLVMEINQYLALPWKVTEQNPTSLSFDWTILFYRWLLIVVKNHNEYKWLKENTKFGNLFERWCVQKNEWKRRRKKTTWIMILNVQLRMTFTSLCAEAALQSYVDICFCNWCWVIAFFFLLHFNLVYFLTFRPQQTSFLFKSHSLNKIKRNHLRKWNKEDERKKNGRNHELYSKTNDAENNKNKLYVNFRISYHSVSSASL